MVASGTAMAGRDADAGDVYPREARLAFALSPGGVTYLRKQHVSYPFHICAPFHVEGDPPGMASLYLQSCAGGVFEGDHLNLDASLLEEVERGDPHRAGGSQDADPPREVRWAQQIQWPHPR